MKYFTVSYTNHCPFVPLFCANWHICPGILRTLTSFEMDLLESNAGGGSNSESYPIIFSWSNVIVTTFYQYVILKMWSPNTVTYNAHASVSVKAYQTVEICQANDRDQRAPPKYVPNSLSHRHFYFTNTNFTFSSSPFTYMEDNKMNRLDYRIGTLAEFYKLRESKFYLLFQIRHELWSNSSSTPQHAMGCVWQLRLSWCFSKLVGKMNWKGDCFQVSKMGFWNLSSL